MYLSHLSLTHFRNYASFDLTFDSPLTLLQGQNAQGKTNLLEAIYFLATSKPVHAQTEREVVGWQAQDEPIPYTRVAAQLYEHSLGDRTQNERPTQLEILLTPREHSTKYKKQVKINGVSKRSMDLIGLMRAVLFLPEDIKLVDGSPSERRRYLDIALCQMDRTYCQNLSAYQKVVSQRNSLLKTLREQAAPAYAPTTVGQMAFWDEKLVTHGSLVIARRYQFLQQLQQVATQRHISLSDQREQLTLCYVPSFNPGCWSEPAYRRVKEDDQVAFGPDDTILVDSPNQETATTNGLQTSDPNNNYLEDSPSIITEPILTVAKIQDTYHQRLAERRPQELASGTTLYGPHRDDFRFFANGRNLRIFGSRGQQRTAALSIKLAELQVMTTTTGATPLLLLDDVMSELDAERRSTLLSALTDVKQAIVTTTDWDDFTPAFRAQAQLLQVQNGSVSRYSM